MGGPSDPCVSHQYGPGLASSLSPCIPIPSVAQEPSAAHLRMGYCPQSDAIFELLTGREHLELFARLRGVPEAQVARTAGLGLARLGLSWYADRPAGTYSGGNKRKLATAVALVGDPAVVFLPTTGMDPSARRFLWNSLLAVVREGRSVILTSHSMEECEALCSRLAIMVNGRFRCLGSAQHLKGRFAAGHTLTLRVPAEKSRSAAAFVAAEFPGAELREAHGGRLRFQLPPGGRCALARVFGELAAHGAEHSVEDFSVSQTMLEEVITAPGWGWGRQAGSQAACGLTAPCVPAGPAHCQVFLYFSKDQGKDEEEDAEEQKETRVGVDPGPGLPRPKRVSQFLHDPSTLETAL
ncbi:Phospholipid-transporting ATPase abca7 [Saguinus oedipus]|uniref:Phospholipid-transporting ATPase abca7 n=1 Tax=Saguinus oedipus TaxID=9490 RepID=A0ABQ9TR00_SAGOE|nr:Phospholipid-transporting ATPase abca7 [Saguinus oedipus]